MSTFLPLRARDRPYIGGQESQDFELGDHTDNVLPRLEGARRVLLPVNEGQSVDFILDEEPRSLQVVSHGIQGEHVLVGEGFLGLKFCERGIKKDKEMAGQCVRKRELPTFPGLDEVIIQLNICLGESRVVMVVSERERRVGVREQSLGEENWGRAKT